LALKYIMLQPTDIIDKIPNTPGAYGFVTRLQEPLQLDIGKFDRVILNKGLYFYGGSAYGPGGLKARLGRHIRPKSSLHWHIDHITSKGRLIALGIVAGGSECALVAQAAAMRNAEFPVPGFGSSDCSTCQSHLVKLKRVRDIQQIFAAAGVTKKWRF